MRALSFDDLLAQQDLDMMCAHVRTVGVAGIDAFGRLQMWARQHLFVDTDTDAWSALMNNFTAWLFAHDRTHVFPEAVVQLVRGQLVAIISHSNSVHWFEDQWPWLTQRMQTLLSNPDSVVAVVERVVLARNTHMLEALLHNSVVRTLVLHDPQRMLPRMHMFSKIGRNPELSEVYQVFVPHLVHPQVGRAVTQSLYHAALFHGNLAVLAHWISDNTQSLLPEHARIDRKELYDLGWTQRMCNSRSLMWLMAQNPNIAPKNLLIPLQSWVSTQGMQMVYLAEARDGNDDVLGEYAWADIRQEIMNMRHVWAKVRHERDSGGFLRAQFCHVFCQNNSAQLVYSNTAATYMLQWLIADLDAEEIDQLLDGHGRSSPVLLAVPRINAHILAQHINTSDSTCLSKPRKM